MDKLDEHNKLLRGVGLPEVSSFDFGDGSSFFNLEDTEFEKEKQRKQELQELKAELKAELKKEVKEEIKEVKEIQEEETVTGALQIYGDVEDRLIPQEILDTAIKDESKLNTEKYKYKKKRRSMGKVFKDAFSNALYGITSNIVVFLAKLLACTLVLLFMFSLNYILNPTLEAPEILKPVIEVVKWLLEMLIDFISWIWGRL